MNRSEQLHQLIRAAFPEERPRTSTDERILHDASTIMKQSHPAIKQQSSASKWRRIMRSPITRTAAMIAIIISAFWVYYQSVGNPDGSPTVLSLLNAATATENTWFAGEQTVHVVNQIVISPQHDVNDPDLLLKNLESNYDWANLEALYRRVLTPRGMEFFSLDSNGDRHNHHLELVDPQAGEATIEDHIWYDPGTGRYARLLTRTDRVLFAHSFDGQRVYLAQRDDQGKLKIQSDPVTASFSAPKDLAGFLGSTTARVRKLLEVKDIFIQGDPTESTLRGKAVSVYKLSYVPFLDKGFPYVQLSVDKNDQSIAKIEFITGQKTALTIDHLSRTQGEFPTVGWDMSALPGSHELPAPDVTVRSEIGRSGLTVQEMADRATFPVFIFGKDPYGTLHRTIYESIDPVSPADRLFINMYETHHDVAVGLLQSRTLDRFVKAQNKDVNWPALITTSNGFNVYDLDANGNAFLLNFLFARLNKKAAENRSCYLLRSPDDQMMFLGIDGWLSNSELEQLTASLVSAQGYKPTNESLPKTVVDLSLATHTELKHNDYITRWLLLGRFDLDAYGSDPTDDQTKKKAFDDEPFDHTGFTPRVRVGNQDYTWTSCYSRSMGPGRVYGNFTPGICYGRTCIIESEETEAVLAINSSGAVKIWLNGQLVHEVWGAREFGDGSDLIPVTLRAGENHLVYKTLRGKDEWEFWQFSCRYKAASTELYESTTEEQARGFIPVQGNGPEPRPRLKRLEVDLGCQERDLVPVQLVGLSELDTVSIRFSGPGASLCRPWVEKDYQLHAGAQTALGPTRPARIWLEVDSNKHHPGVYELTVHLSSGIGTELRIPGTVTIHDVTLPEERTMGVKLFADVVRLSEGTSTQPEAQKRLEVFLDDLAALRTKSCDWGFAHWAKLQLKDLLPLVKIVGTGQTLQAAGQAGILDINNLPDLDFSYFDPWIAGAAQHGLTHLNMTVRHRLTGEDRAFVEAVLGNDIVCSDETTWKMLMWLYDQFRDYAISRGMTETWACIGLIELAPADIQEYIQAASRYQAIGYRTYTNKTCMVSQNARWLNQLNAQSDAWYMNIWWTQGFLRLTRPTQGQAAVPLDESDQFCYNEYGTCRTSYEEGRRTAWRCLAIGAHGYKWHRYWYANTKDKVVWYDQEKECIIHSPTWHGLRDGNEDAAYYHMLQQRLQAQGDQAGLARLAALTGEREDAPLRMTKINNVPAYNDIAGPIGFHQFNQAKREVLRMLCTDQ